MGPINAGYELGLQYPIATGIGVGAIIVIGLFIGAFWPTLRKW